MYGGFNKGSAIEEHKTLLKWIRMMGASGKALWEGLR